MLGTALLLAGCRGPLSTLEPAGPSAQAAAWLWWGMSGFFTLVLLVVIGLWLRAVFRDPGQPGEGDAQKVHNHWIVWGGLVLPTASIVVILVAGIPLGQRMLALPLAKGEALRIDVTAHQWWWEVRHPGTDIVMANKLHIPAGEPIDLHLTSRDVIHSFWVPRLGGKMDVFPGRTNVLRLQADQPGIYHGTCSEFCGLGHAHMQFTVEALAADDFRAWLEKEKSGDRASQ